MEIESLNCPNCAAPLTMVPGQTLIICGYCNSTLRISQEKDSGTSIAHVPEISSDVIDEVKRLLIGSMSSKAVNYYRQKTGATQSDAFTAVNEFKKTIGQNPPLNKSGFYKLILLFIVSIIIIIAGIFLISIGAKFLGLTLIVVTILFVLFNYLALRGYLNSYFLSRNGTLAEAEIMRFWEVKSFPPRGKLPAYTLMRLLLRVYPAGSDAYQAEANCNVKEQSRQNFKIGSTVQVKYDRGDKKKIVIFHI